MAGGKKFVAMENTDRLLKRFVRGDISILAPGCCLNLKRTMAPIRCDRAPLLPRRETLRRTFLLFSLGLVCGPLIEVRAATDRLRVALVSGAPTYGSDEIMEKAKRNLETLYPINCTLILANPTGEGFDHIDALAEADVAVFLIRRKTPPPEALAAIRKFVDSGKGLVALGPTSHGFENWPTFDVDVLGAKYGGPYAEGKGITDIRLRPSPIFTGGEDFTTDKYVYKYTGLAKDVRVLMEGGHGTQLTPIAWTRERNGTRIFYMGPAQKESFNQSSYLRIVANSIFWAARREVPGAVARINRTWMPNSYPSSVAVGFPSGLNYCFDPTRGALAYAWDGDYIDRWPTIAGKFPRDANVPGKVFYRAPEQNPFRSGNTDPAKIAFKGYHVENNVPQFRYEVDGLAVTETVTPKEDGTGLNRHFRVETSGQPFRYKPDDVERVTLQQGPAKWVEGQLQLPARSVIEFNVFLPR